MLTYEMLEQLRLKLQSPSGGDSEFFTEKMAKDLQEAIISLRNYLDVNRNLIHDQTIIDRVTNYTSACERVLLSRESVKADDQGKVLTILSSVIDESAGAGVDADQDPASGKELKDLFDNIMMGFIKLFHEIKPALPQSMEPKNGEAGDDAADDSDLDEEDDESLGGGAGGAGAETHELGHASVSTPPTSRYSHELEIKNDQLARELAKEKECSTHWRNEYHSMAVKEQFAKNNANEAVIRANAANKTADKAQRNLAAKEVEFESLQERVHQHQTANTDLRNRLTRNEEKCNELICELDRYKYFAEQSKQREQEAKKSAEKAEERATDAEFRVQDAEFNKNKAQEETAKANEATKVAEAAAAAAGEKVKAAEAAARAEVAAAEKRAKEAEKRAKEAEKRAKEAAEAQQTAVAEAEAAQRMATAATEAAERKAIEAEERVATAQAEAAKAREEAVVTAQAAAHVVVPASSTVVAGDDSRGRLLEEAEARAARATERAKYYEEQINKLTLELALLQQRLRESEAATADERKRAETAKKAADDKSKSRDLKKAQKISELTNKSKGLENEIEKLRRKLKKYTSIDRSQFAHERYRLSVQKDEELKQQVQEAEKRVAELTAVSEEKQKKIQELEHILTSNITLYKQIEINTLNRREKYKRLALIMLQSAEAEKIKLTENIEILTKKNEDTTILQSRLTDLESTYRKLEEEYQNLEEKHVERHTQLNQLAVVRLNLEEGLKKLEKLRDENKTLKEQLEKQREFVSSATNAIEEARERAQTAINEAEAERRKAKEASKDRDAANKRAEEATRGQKEAEAVTASSAAEAARARAELDAAKVAHTAELARREQQANESISEAQSKVAIVQTKLARLGDEKTALEKNIETTKAALEAAKDKAKTAEQKIETVTGEAASNAKKQEEQIKKLQEELNELKTLNSTLNASITLLQSKKDDADRELARVSDELNIAKKDYQSRLQELKAQHAQALEDIKAAANASAKTRIEEATDAFNARAATLETEKNAAVDAQSALQGDNTRLSGELGDLRAQVEKLTEEGKELSRANTSLQEESDRKSIINEEQAGRFNLLLAEATAARTAATAAIEAAEEKAAEATADATAADGRAAAAEQRVAEATAATAAAEAGRAAAQTALAAADGRAATAAAATATADGRAAEAEAAAAAADGRAAEAVAAAAAADAATAEARERAATADGRATAPQTSSSRSSSPASSVVSTAPTMVRKNTQTQPASALCVSVVAKPTCYTSAPTNNGGVRALITRHAPIASTTSTTSTTPTTSVEEAARQFKLYTHKKQGYNAEITSSGLRVDVPAEQALNKDDKVTIPVDTFMTLFLASSGEENTPEINIDLNSTDKDMLAAFCVIAQAFEQQGLVTVANKTALESMAKLPGNAGIIKKAQASLKQRFAMGDGDEFNQDILVNRILSIYTQQTVESDNNNAALQSYLEVTTSVAGSTGGTTATVPVLEERSLLTRCRERGLFSVLRGGNSAGGDTATEGAGFNYGRITEVFQSSPIEGQEAEEGASVHSSYYTNLLYFVNYNPEASSASSSETASSGGGEVEEVREGEVASSSPRTSRLDFFRLRQQRAIAREREQEREERSGSSSPRRS